MIARRREWSQQHKALRQALSKKGDRDEAIAIFLEVHGLLHRSELAQPGELTFADAVWEGINEEGVRRIPNNEEHSVAWLLWHCARIEDITMTMLVAGTRQVFDEGNWLAKLGIAVQHSGNNMTPAEVADLSARIDIEGLKAYRLAVGERTRGIVGQLKVEQFQQQVDAARIQQVRESGAVVAAASGIIDYWSTRTVAGLLLMPATRHNMLHLNEALRVKNRRR